MVWLATLLLLSLLVGMGRLLKGPTRADRLLTVQLFGTVGTAILLLLAHWQAAPALRDVALVLALLAAVLSGALVQYLRRPGSD